MTRKEAKELVNKLKESFTNLKDVMPIFPIIEAYAIGKEIKFLGYNNK